MASPDAQTPTIFRTVALRDDQPVACYAKREGAGFRCATLSGPTWFTVAVFETFADAEQAVSDQAHALDL